MKLVVPAAGVPALTRSSVLMLKLRCPAAGRPDQLRRIPSVGGRPVVVDGPVKRWFLYAVLGEPWK